MQGQRGDDQQEEESEIKSNTDFQQLLAGEALKAEAKLRAEALHERQSRAEGINPVSYSCQRDKPKQSQRHLWRQQNDLQF